MTDSRPDLVVFTASSGRYELKDSTGHLLYISENESVVLGRFKKMIYLKPHNAEGFLCDTVFMFPLSDSANFSLRTSGGNSQRKYYNGYLKCFSDMEKLLLINSCEIEKYLPGVVKAEGGSGKNQEYFRTQAIIARTYTYKYLNKHILDGYNLCDDTHCQVYEGLIYDSTIIRSVLDTRGLVITTPDSLLIISAFHSNCGGETSASEDAWVTEQPYLKRVIDPYCRNSRNALWGKKIGLREWTKMLQLNGYTGSLDDPSVFNSGKPERTPDYTAADFKLPMRIIRTKFDLRSAFFAVSVDGDSVLLKGRGYGHGVGLCQEGAMNMALKGMTYRQIINFYYFNVLILDIKDAYSLPPQSLTGTVKQPVAATL